MGAAESLTEPANPHAGAAAQVILGPMPRHPLTRASAVSLVLCALTVALWLVSYWGYLTLNRTHADRLLGVSIRAGDLVLVRDSNASRTDPLTHWEFLAEQPDSLHREGRNRGVVRTSNKRQGVASMLVYIPLWLSFLAFALLPFHWSVITFVTRWRLARHRCPKCSYSLTGNISGICPECGTAVAKGAA
jgi:hypothetical protein